MPKYPAKTYEDIEKRVVNTEYFRNKLKLKSYEASQKFNGKHPQAQSFFKLKNIDLEKIRQYSAKIIGAGALAGTILLSSPNDQLKLLPSSTEVLDKLKDKITGNDQYINHKFLVDTLNSVLPKNPKPIARNEEKFLEQIFKNVLNINTRASLEGEHLNTTYGYIGIEQHLMRYPGDSLSGHSKYRDILGEGIAPGLGAWGYFASSKEKITPDLENTEKWYAVVQTLYLPDWTKRQPYLRDWYKYRKILIVNTQNGNAVIAAVADSGPAAWTGKQFGGSPEVMQALGGEQFTKGKVIVFFVDDPDHKAPLGPIEYN